MSARELVHQIKPKKPWNLTGSPASFQHSHNACQHAVRCTRNLVSSGDRLVGLYRAIAGTQRTFVKCPAVGISYIRTETQGDGNQPDRILHTPYLTCTHCKQSGATTVTPCTAWHAVSCGHMSAVRSEGALVAEEYLDFMRWNAVQLGWMYSRKWHMGTKQLCRQARAVMLLCTPNVDIDWELDGALGTKAELSFPTLRSGATDVHREYFHRAVGRALNDPIAWRCTDRGWMISGMVLSFLQRNLHLYRSPVLQRHASGTIEDPEHRIVPENLSYRCHFSRRVFAQQDMDLEVLSDLPLYESDRRTWKRTPHVNRIPALDAHMTLAETQSMPVAEGQQSPDFTYHLEGGAVPIVFQAQLPQAMLPLMRPPKDTQQPEGYDSHHRYIEGNLCDADEPRSRPEWRVLLEREGHESARIAARQKRMECRTPREVAEHDDPSWTKGTPYPMADVAPAFQEA